MRRLVLPLALMAVAIGILIALPPASYAFRSDVGQGGSSRTLTLPEEARAVTYDVANAAPELNAFRRRVGGVWAMARNPETGTAHAVWGSGLEFPSARGAAPAVLEAIGRRFIDENPDLFGVSSRDLSVLSLRTRAGKTSIIFQQRWQDVPVWGARVHVVFHESGRIVAFGSDARRGIAADVQPGLDRPAAYRRAGNWLEIRDGGRELGAELWIVPTGGKDRLAWRTLVGEGPGQAAWALLVDAHDGTILTSQQLSYEADVAGAVSGAVDWLAPCDGPRQDRPFPDLLVDLGAAGSTYTDAPGFFSVPTASEDPVDATLMLRGRYALVHDFDGTDAVITQQLEPGGVALIEWQDANSTPAERDVYLFTNTVRTGLLGVDPEFIGTEYDFPFECLVNFAYLTRPFNASWSWDGEKELLVFNVENLDALEPTQNAGRMADVVAHEFGHSLTAHVYGGPASLQPNLSIHEGNSDVAAALWTQDPVLAEGYIIADCGSFIRTADNTLQYPNDYVASSGHANARILSGVYWDAYEYLRAHGSTGDEARAIVMQCWHDGRMLGLPLTYPDQLYWTYIADDDDGDLANGTPHGAALDFGGTNHGFQSLNELVAAQGLFTDVTTSALELPVGSGTAWGDFDDDKDFDLFVTSASTDSNQTSRLLRNDAGTFTDVTPTVLALMGCHAAAWGDFDEDGDQDLAVAHWQAGGRLFRNAGGVFTDITPAAFATATNPNSVSWVDYDKDGDLDLHLASNLYRNDGGGAFSVVTGQPLSEVGQVMASAWTDYDRDGDSDVFLARVGAPCLLIRNNGNGTFADVTPTVLQIPEGALAAAWGDYDNDGDPDLVISGWFTGMKTRLFRYDGGTTFTEIIESDLNGSLGWCVEWADYDCDGRLDLYVSGPLTNVLLHNDGGNAFTDRSADPIWNAAWGVSAGWADYDGDGDLDVYLANWVSSDGGFSPELSIPPEQGCRLLRNENATGNGWLEVDLVGTISNHDGVGARLKLETNAGFYYRQGEGGGGHATQNARRIHFGIGASTSIKGLKVTWPSGKASSVTGIARNSRITVIEPTNPLPPTPHQTVSNAGFAPRLLAVSPNPWRDETAIRFSLARADAPVIRIYDVSGRRVREGVLGVLPGGIHEWAWDGRDDCGNLVVGGIYFLRFQTPGHTETMRMVKLGR